MTENSRIILLVLTLIQLPFFIYLIIVHIIDYAKHKQKKNIKSIICLLISIILYLILLSVVLHVPAFLYQ